MRIAFLVNVFPHLSETFILNQITGLIDRGHEVDVFAQRPTTIGVMHADVRKYRLVERTYYWPSWTGGRVYRGTKWLCAAVGRSVQSRRALANTARVLTKAWGHVGVRPRYRAVSLLDKNPYDVIHCHFAPNGVIAVQLRDIGAITGKVITTFHGYDVNNYPRKYGQDVYRRLFEKGDLYTSNTRFTAGKATLLGCPEDKIVILPVGLKPSRFRFQQRVFRRDEPVRLLTVANLVEKKGIEYAIRAVAEVARNHPNIRYTIVGAGPLEASLRRLVSDLGLDETVEFAGGRTHDELPAFYANAHLFLLVSVTASDGDQEGQALVLQEAQATGLPVLSTLHNGIPEGVLDGQSGFLVPERDVHALAERLDWLICHPEHWPEMGRAGREFVEQRYDIEQLNDRLVEIYGGLLEGVVRGDGSREKERI